MNRQRRQSPTPPALHARKLVVELLEDRRLLSITVNTLVDENDGVEVGGISLRDAIGAAASGETIDFAPSLTSGGPATIALTHYSLYVSRGVTIRGPGADLLTVTTNGQGRIFEILYGSENVDIGGLTITRGRVEGPSNNGGAILALGSGTLRIHECAITYSQVAGTNASGGGIYCSGPTIISNSKISFNGIKGGDVAAYGGGIKCSGGLTITNCEITDNKWDYGYGGGISGIGTISNSTIARNSAMNGTGGGLYGTWTITNSTIVDNSSGIGGGVYAGVVAITNSTVSGNAAQHVGGIFAGTIVLTNSTISENSSGIGATDSLTLRGSIVAGNAGPGGVADLLFVTGTLTSNYSLIGDTVGLSPGIIAAINSGAGNLLNLDPLLGPLADNGGPTKTYATLPGSPAINAGDPSYLGPSSFDQRGFAFARVVGGGIDIGAFEVGAVSANFDGDDDVDGNDFLVWQRHLGTTASNGLNSDGDADIDRDVDGDDLVLWRNQFGTSAPTIATAQAVAAANSNAARDEVYATQDFPLVITDLPEFRPLSKRRLRFAR